MTLFLSEDDVQELLTPSDAVEAVEGSFRRMGAGVVELVPRRRLELQEGRLADMAASDLELGYACVKTYAATGDGATTAGATRPIAGERVQTSRRQIYRCRRFVR